MHRAHTATVQQKQHGTQNLRLASQGRRPGQGPQPSPHVRCPPHPRALAPNAVVAEPIHEAASTTGRQGTQAAARARSFSSRPSSSDSNEEGGWGFCVVRLRRGRGGAESAPGQPAPRPTKPPQTWDAWCRRVGACALARRHRPCPAFQHKNGCWRKRSTAKKAPTSPWFRAPSATSWRPPPKPVPSPNSQQPSDSENAGNRAI